MAPLAGLRSNEAPAECLLASAANVCCGCFRFLPSTVCPLGGPPCSTLRHVCRGRLHDIIDGAYRQVHVRTQWSLLLPPLGQHHGVSLSVSDMVMRSPAWLRHAFGDAAPVCVPFVVEAGLGMWTNRH